MPPVRHVPVLPELEVAAVETVALLDVAVTVPDDAPEIPPMARLPVEPEPEPAPAEDELAPCAAAGPQAEPLSRRTANSARFMRDPSNMRRL